MSSKEKRVLWTEGLFLSPQNFQQQERAIFNHVQARTKPIEPHYWGVVDLEIRTDELDNGVFLLNGCSGIFPDGTPFDTSDTLLESKIGEDANNHFIFLGIGNNQERTSEVVLPEDKQDKPTIRYITEALDVVDVQTINASQKNEKIPVGKLNFQLFISKYPIDNYTQIAIAKIQERSATGVVLLDRSFVPPTLYSHTSPIIKNYIRSTYSQLVNRGETLSKRLITPDASSVSTIIDLNLLLIINRYTPLFHYYTSEEKIHPREIYTQSLKMVGELATIASEDKIPEKYEPYTHDNLQASFYRLFKDIQKYLQYSAIPKAISIPLLPHEKFPTVYSSAHLSESIFSQHSRFVLSVRGDLSLGEIQTRIHKTTTLASTLDLLQQLVSSHTQGIPLIMQPSVPREIPYHSNCVYFDLDTHSDHWRKVVQSRYITAHIDNSIPGLKFELWAIRGKDKQREI